MQYESRRFLHEWTEKVNKGQLFEAFLETLPMDQRATFKDKKDAPEFQRFKDGSFLLEDGKPMTEEARKKAAEEALRPFALNLMPGTATAQAGPPMVDYGDRAIWIINLIEVNQSTVAQPIVAYITIELQGDDMVAEINKLRSGDWKQFPILPPVQRDSTQESDRFPNRSFRMVNINLRPSEPRLVNPMAPGGRGGP
jgi:hypothetical protein